METTPRPIPELCALHTHLIQKLPTGRYVCVYGCGLQVSEHHELVIMCGAGAQPRTLDARDVQAGR
jgi:hypothetical protein